jgi:hypothetical protein
MLIVAKKDIFIHVPQFTQCNKLLQIAAQPGGGTRGANSAIRSAERASNDSHHKLIFLWYKLLKGIH